MTQNDKNERNMTAVPASADAALPEETVSGELDQARLEQVSGGAFKFRGN